MPVQVQKEAPDFTAKAVVNGQITPDDAPYKLSSNRGKYIVLFFYPLDFTFVCPTEIIAFSDRIAEFEKRNCQVVGVSVAMLILVVAAFVQLGRAALDTRTAART